MPSRLQQFLQWCFKRFQLLTVNCPRWSDNVAGQPGCPSCPSWRSHPVKHNPWPNPKSNLKHKHKHKPNTEATHQHQHLTRDAANQLMLLGRWLSGCCQAKSGGGSRDGAVRSFPIPFVALSYDYIKQTLRQRITCIRQGPVTVP